MDEEFLLTILYIMAGFGAILYLVYLVWFMRTVESFREEPFLALCAWLSMAGALLFFGSMVSMGYLSFGVSTPWGTMPSEWVGVLVALLTLAVRYVVSERKRKKRLRSIGTLGGG